MIENGAVLLVWALWLILMHSISIGDLIRAIATGFLLLLAVVLIVFAGFFKRESA